MPASELFDAIKNKQKEEMLRILEAEPVLRNQVFKGGTLNGLTILHQAVLFDAPELLEELLQRGVMVCTSVTPAQPVGVTPLMTAIWHQNIACLKILSKVKDIPLGSNTAGGHNALTNAVETNNPEIVQLVMSIPGSEAWIDVKRKVDSKSALDIALEKNNPKIIEIITGGSYPGWLKAQGKLDNAEFFSAYIKELKENKLQKGAVKEAVLARKLWSDVVSAMDHRDVEFAKENKVKDKVIERLRSLGYVDDTESILEDCIIYLQNCPIVMSFNASKFAKESLKERQVLNVFEIIYKDDNYKKTRIEVEDTLFQELSSDASVPAAWKKYNTKLADQKPYDIARALKANNHARPRYAKLELLDHKQSVQPIISAESYGTSYIVLKKIVNFSSLFVPSNPYNYHVIAKKSYIPASYNQLEVFLYQCTDAKLKALAERVTKGALSADYIPHNAHEQGFVTVLLPGIDFLNPDFIEHIHVDPAEYKLKEDEAKALEHIGITATNSAENPYPELSRKLLEHVEKNEIHNVENLLKKFPSLLDISNSAGETPVQIAIRLNYQDMIRMLVKQGAYVNKNKEIKNKLFFFIDNNNLDEAKNILEKIDLKDRKIAVVIQDAFEHAVKNKKYNFLNFLVEKGANPNKLDAQDKSHLHRAVENRDEHLVSVLVNLKRINLNIAAPNNSFTPMHVLCGDLKEDSNSVKLLNTLASRGCDTGSLTAWSETPLYLAINRKNWQLAKEILQRYYANINIEHAVNNDTVLIQAVLQRNIEIVKLILGNKDFYLLNHMDKNGESALFIAAKLGDLELVKVLLSKTGIDYHAKRLGDKKPAWQIAKDNNHFIVAIEIVRHQIQLLKDASANIKEYEKLLAELQMEMLIHAIKSKNINEIGKVLKERLDINAFSKEGKTALHYAVETNDPAKVYLILKTPFIDANKRARDNSTPLSLACRQNGINIQIILELLKCSAVENLEEAYQAALSNHQLEIALEIKMHEIQLLKHAKKAHAAEEKTALDLENSLFRRAVKDKNIQNIKKMAALGADVNVFVDGKTALHEAIELKDIDLVNALLELKGIDIESRISKSTLEIFYNTATPLILACHKKDKIDLAIVQALLRHKADPNVQLGENNTSSLLNVVLYHNNVELFKLLLRSGAILSIKDYLDSIDLGHDAITQMIVEHVFENLEQSQSLESHPLRKFVDLIFKQAVLKGNIEVMNQALKFGADPNYMVDPNNEYSALHIAAKTNNIAMANALLEYKTTNRHVKNSSGITPLILAVLSKNTEMLILCIKRKLLINEKDQNGESALFIAVKQGDVNAVEIILSAAVIDFEAKRIPGDGKTALQYAIEDAKRPDIAKLILEVAIKAVENTNQQYKKTGRASAKKLLSQALNVAIELDAEFFEKILPYCNTDSINQTNSNDETALYTAAKEGDLRKVQMLLKIPGIDIGAINSKTKLSAFNVAEQNGHVGVAALLHQYQRIASSANISNLNLFSEQNKMLQSYEAARKIHELVVTVNGIELAGHKERIAEIKKLKQRCKDISESKQDPITIDTLLRERVNEFHDFLDLDTHLQKALEIEKLYRGRNSEKLNPVIAIKAKVYKAYSDYAAGYATAKTLDTIFTMELQTYRPLVINPAKKSLYFQIFGKRTQRDKKLMEVFDQIQGRKKNI